MVFLFRKKKSPATGPSLKVATAPPTVPRVVEPAVSAPTSPSALLEPRDFARPPPSSVRHLRVLSVSLGLDAIFSPQQLMRQHQRDIAHDLPPELVPVVNLINAHSLRQYAAGPVLVVVGSALEPTCAHATLVGTELLLLTDSLLHPRYLNVQDCTVRLVELRDGGAALAIWQDFDSKHVTLQCADPADSAMWLAAFQLAKYEQTALSEAFTGVVLSLKGPALSDIGTLLAHRKRFVRYEWCNMRLPQVLSKWVKVFVAATPGDGKKSGRVEIYTSDKMTKRSLVVYINSASAVYNVYPEDHKMIDVNLMLKIEGEVFVNRSHESLFHHDTLSPLRARSREPSLTSLLLLPALPAPLSDHALAPPPHFGGRRSRSGSVLSTLSFFENAASPDPEPALPRSPSSTNFFKRQTATNFVTSDHMYLMPLPHPGVSGVETMIRNWIQLVDTFRLYGRPDHLSSDKTDPHLMLFGLPYLPCYGYLSMHDAFTAVDANFDTARFNAWGLLQWQACFKELIRLKQMDLDYKGVGHINDLLLSVGDFGELPSPKITLPRHSRVGSPLLQSDGATSPFATPVGLNDGQFLGQPLDHQRMPPQLQMTRDDIMRSLGPIPDMPTPLDDGQTAYFDRDDKLRVTPGVTF